MRHGDGIANSRRSGAGARRGPPVAGVQIVQDVERFEYRFEPLERFELLERNLVVKFLFCPG
jgi:hypothetical protein